MPWAQVKVIRVGQDDLRALAVFAVIRRHQLWVTRAGGLMLVLVGVLLVTGLWDQMVQWLQIRMVTSFETAV